jgi:dipeptidyl aminopeptidase/acylaminoacyl peptidase
MKKRKMSAEDLLKLKFVNYVVMSPDESGVMFTASAASDDKKKYFSHIYMINIDGSDLRQYTSGEVADSNPVFSPDGKWIVFTSKRGEKKGIYRMPTGGGEAKLLVDKDGSYSELSVSPDSRKILCIFTKADDVPKGKDGKKEEPVCRHITRLFYKLDNSGYLPKDRGHVFIYDIETGEGTQIGRMKNGERSPVWFPNGRHIAFISNTQRDPDREMLKDDIFVISAKGGKPRKLLKPEGEAVCLSVSPDGKFIAFVGQDDPNDAWGVKNLHVWKVPVSGGRAIDLTSKLDRMALDLTISDTGESDGLMTPHWSPDGRKLYFLMSDSGATQLCTVSAAGGNIRKVIGGKAHVGGASLAGKSKLVAAIISTPTTPAEVHIASIGVNARPKRLTSLNSELVKGLDIRKPEEVIVRGNDGNAIHGWILKPPRFSPKRKYPSIMQIHGGPRVQYGYSFFHEMQYLAAAGYVVYYCNPRGGQGYGMKHAESIVNKWGSVDYDDCMSMADYMADKKYIDTRKMGVTGGSYGGYMTNWIVTHTNRFCAAVTQRSVTNLISFYGSSDFGFDIGREIKGSPYTETDAWWEMSPIKHVRNIKTPLLIIHSENDLRCPIEQGEQLFAALKMLRRKVEMVRFPGEPHGLSRCGRPDRRISRLGWLLKWFDRYLKGKK